jgi:ABC-type transport system involved in multi-copper enzyme maturation permease subunit
MIKAYFLVNRSVLIWLSVLFFLMFGIGYVMEHLYVLPGFYFIWVVAASFVQSEEKNKTDQLYCSLPVKRSTIVAARYGGVLVAYLLVTVFSLAMILFIKLANFEGVVLPSPLVTLPMVAAPLAPVAFFFAFGMPFYFRYGYNKGMVIGFFIMAGLTTLGSWILDLVIKGLAEPEVWQALNAKIHLARPFNLIMGGVMRASLYFGGGTFLLGASLVTAVLTFFSYRLSLKLYNNKDI